jgi:hypothetical protein
MAARLPARRVFIISAGTSLIFLAIVEILLPSSDRLPNVMSFFSVILVDVVATSVVGLWLEFREPIDARLLIACIASTAIWVAVGLIDRGSPLHSDMTLATGPCFTGLGLLGEAGMVLARRRAKRMAAGQAGPASQPPSSGSKSLPSDLE